MKLQMLSRYGRQGASSRLRMFFYEPYLTAAGITATQEPFFDNTYLQRLYGGQRSRARVAAAYWARLKQMRRSKDADAIWLEKEAMPWVPAGLETALLPSGVPLITDYDDAVFHSYDLHRLGVVQRGLGHKIDQVMARSDLVMAGNAYLAERAETAGARRVELVPTVVDTDVYAVNAARVAEAKPYIGWVGTPSTWQQYLMPMIDLLEELTETLQAGVRTVGASPEAATYPFLDAQVWSEDTEVSQIQAMDIGIMPLTDTPWARGKCGYKLIQYMACGLPVVASPVGVNTEIVDHGVNGFLASTEAEWREALVTLLRDPDLRAQMGAAGRRKIEDHYSLQVWGPKVAQLLKEAAKAD